MGINQDGEEMNGSKRNLTIIEETIETEEETVDPHNTEPLNVDPPQQPPSNPKQEVPVIAMTDFSAVNMEEKLNLLMVAINKINIKPDTPITVYTRFCLNTAKSKFSLVSPVADW